ncbi:MAG: Flp pilus assembly complex ATPase component TadA [Oscillospiraceae bacterium]|nr:Flp pilus assembly complex ATPase component TadA [Oscillospiraceae bacterium]
MQENAGYVHCIGYLTPQLCRLLGDVPDDIKRNAREIRLRAGRSVVIDTGGGLGFLRKQGGTTAEFGGDSYIITAGEVADAFKIICGYSIHSYADEIRQGFITLKGGHRAGICGTAVTENGRVTSAKDISSINIRIARNIPGIADQAVRHIYNAKGTLIAGIPASGKTTLLKGIISRFASGRGGYRRVAVIDTRGELGAAFCGEPQNDVGQTADIFDGYPKGEGILMAIRTMSPDIIVIDEIGSREEADSIMECMNAGVSIIATVHAGTPQELSKRRHIMQLVECGSFEKIIFLEGREHPCRIKKIMGAEDLYAY